MLQNLKNIEVILLKIMRLIKLFCEQNSVEIGTVIKKCIF